MNHCILVPQLTADLTLIISAVHGAVSKDWIQNSQPCSLACFHAGTNTNTNTKDTKRTNTRNTRTTVTRTNTRNTRKTVTRKSNTVTNTTRKANRRGLLAKRGEYVCWCTHHSAACLQHRLALCVA